MRVATWLLLVGWGSAGAGLAAESRLHSRTLWRLTLEIPAEGLAGLRESPRGLVQATLRDGTQTWPRVAVRLKGRTGSFRPVDDRPSLTVVLDEYDRDARFQGYARLHLNNSVEDPSFLHERLGTHLFQSAGIPAPDVGHAIVTLNGRRLGLYVLKEGFTRDFLARHFARSDGNLYDPEAAGDVTDPLKRSLGDGPTDRRDLVRLSDAARESDLAARWQRLGTVLDRDGFLRFLAVESLAGHRDGYGVARNNYRLYQDPGSDRFVFLPTGMDVLFGRADYPVQPEFVGLVARALVEIPAGRAGYRRELLALQSGVFDTNMLIKLVRGWTTDLIRELPVAESRSVYLAADDLTRRIQLRQRDVGRQLSLPPGDPVRFTNGPMVLVDWRAVDEPAGGRLDREPTPNGRKAWRIQAGPVTAGSWRSRARLSPGTYRFAASTWTTGLKPLRFGRTQGVGLSVVGDVTVNKPSALVLADVAGSVLSMEFTVHIEGTVELVWGCRASAGQAWMIGDSPRLELLRP